MGKKLPNYQYYQASKKKLKKNVTYRAMSITSCLSSFAALSSVTKLNTHTGEKLFVWFRSTFTGHESKHSCLHEEKNHPFEMVPFRP